MNDDEARRRDEFALKLHEHLATAGPAGEVLSAKIAPLLDTTDMFEILVALSLLRCAVEDSTAMPRSQFEFSAAYIYHFIRSQIDANKGTLQ